MAELADPKNEGFGYVKETIPAQAAIYDFVFGGPAQIRASKDWRPFFQPRKVQGWIPFCVSFSRVAIARAMAAANGLIIDFSCRVLGVESGTTHAGNSLEAVDERFRNPGDVKADVCELTQRQLTYSGNDIWADIFNLPDAIKIAKRFTGGNHSWILGRSAMVNAMDYSPLQIAVGIGNNWGKGGIIAPPATITDYHSVALAYIDAQGNMYVQDSLGGSQEWKTLSPDYPLTGVKSFRDLPDNWKDLNQKGKLMQILQVEGEATLVFQNAAGKYFDVATAPELYPFVARQLGLAGQTFGTISRATVNANYGGKLVATLGFVDA